MSNLDDLEKAVTRLEPQELTQFRAWFERFDSDVFDRKIERDAAQGKLDNLADDALAQFRQGRAREL